MKKKKSRQKKRKRKRQAEKTFKFFINNSHMAEESFCAPPLLPPSRPHLRQLENSRREFPAEKGTSPEGEKKRSPVVKNILTRYQRL